MSGRRYGTASLLLEEVFVSIFGGFVDIERTSPLSANSADDVFQWLFHGGLGLRTQWSLLEYLLEPPQGGGEIAMISAGKVFD